MTSVSYEILGIQISAMLSRTLYSVSQQQFSYKVKAGSSKERNELKKAILRGIIVESSWNHCGRQACTSKLPDTHIHAAPAPAPAAAIPDASSMANLKSSVIGGGGPREACERILARLGEMT